MTPRDRKMLQLGVDSAAMSAHAFANIARSYPEVAGLVRDLNDQITMAYSRQTRAALEVGVEPKTPRFGNNGS